MYINNLNLFNLYNYTNKKILNSTTSNNTFIKTAVKNINNLSSLKNNINNSITYNNIGKISTSIAPTQDVWASNNEKLTDNHSSTSIKDMLTDIPDNLKYTGKLTSTEIAEKYVITGKLTPPEEHYLYTVNPTLACEANQKAQVPKAGTEINNALKACNITLNPDEELKITVSRTNKITVSGIADSEKAQKIQEALQSYNVNEAIPFNPSSTPFCLASGLNGATACNLNSMHDFPREVQGLITSTLTATDFLYNLTGAKISVDDLTIKDNKIEGLPSDLDTLLNGTIDKNASIGGIYVSGIKSCIMRVISYTEKYGKENLPIVTSNFTYRNGKLIAIEDPEFSIKANTFKSVSYQ
ncbi:hypothetical protein KTC96_24020 (plasmid) [Clostridium estertheticum]|uniref:hypothetical protein n=1 Tax=Clostridium estertheticum TaxID=238834 RepID=UPI001C7E053E|nr:hypothetical protein [Clostridium estertheticum]MBX4262162.1 hypothetical protein [Clostridium estertheticum]WLC73194.1 hypothetical protein KTC96_24020 [Clostridium estertheticum]